MKIEKQEFHFGNVNQNIVNADNVNYNPAQGGSVEQKQQPQSAPATEPKNPMDTREIPPIREQIMLYVSCLIGQVAEQWMSRYDKLWEGILDLDVVAAQVYDRGKQQGTAFNRNLVANIVHYLGNRPVAADCVYKAYNAAQYTEKLEGDKDHSVRAALGQDPSEDIAKSIGKFIENFKL